MNLAVASELARLLRAEVPPLEDEQFVITLAAAARSSTPVPMRRRGRLGVKLGAIVASVAVTSFGAAYASDLFTPVTPTNSNPTSPGTDEPTDRERQDRGPRNSDDPVEVKPSPATVTQSSEPDDAPTEAEEEQPPHQSDPGPEDDDSQDDEDGSKDDSEGEPDSDDPEPDNDSGPDDDSEGDREDSGHHNDLEEESGGPDLEDPASSDDD